MNKKEKLDNSLLLVSGGVDSMSLLHFFIKKNIQCAVLHINHQTRGVENEKEYLMIKDICECNQINFYYEKYNHISGNFQAKAREFRYEIAANLVEKYNYKQIITAHHRDDLVENILMYENKINNRMIQKETKLNDVTVYRPLLDYYKEQIYEYAVKYNISYNEDVSNQKLTYRRNQFRHNIVAKLSISEKETVIANEEKRITKMPKVKDKLTVNYLQKFSLEQQIYIVDQWLRAKKIVSIRRNLLKQICMSMQNEGSKEHYLSEKQKLLINYGNFKLIKSNNEYNEEFKKLKKGINYFNGIAFECHVDNLYATVRKPGDKIEINGINKRISRVMIEYKIERNLRDCWPIICTKERKLVYLPKKIKK